MRRKVALAPLWPQSGRLSVGCRCVFVEVMCLYLCIWSSVTNRAVAIAVRSPFQSSCELWPLWGLSYVLVVSRLCCRTASPTNSCTISALCDLWILYVVTEFYWRSRSCDVDNLVQSLQNGKRSSKCYCCECRLKMKSAEVGLLQFLTFSTTLQFFSVPLPRSKSTGHSASLPAVATQGPTKVLMRLRPFEALWDHCRVLDEARRLVPSSRTYSIRQHNVERGLRGTRGIAATKCDMPQHTCSSRRPMYQIYAVGRKEEKCGSSTDLSTSSQSGELKRSWRANLFWPVLTFVLAARPFVWDLHTSVYVVAWVCRSAEVVIVNRKCL